MKIVEPCPDLTYNAFDACDHQTKPSSSTLCNTASIVGGVGSLEHVMEVWKSVVGYEGFYEVSDEGRVRSMDRTTLSVLGHKRAFAGRTLKIESNWAGYKRATLIVKNKAKKHSVHRLVALAFIAGKSDLRSHVNHIDGVKGNNLKSNLEWVSPSENSQHGYDNGLMKTRGETHHLSKLNDEKVIEMIGLFHTEGMSDVEIGERYGVSRCTVSRVRQGSTWKHIKRGGNGNN